MGNVCVLEAVPHGYGGAAMFVGGKKSRQVFEGAAEMAQQ